MREWKSATSFRDPFRRSYSSSRIVAVEIVIIESQVTI